MTRNIFYLLIATLVLLGSAMTYQTTAAKRPAHHTADGFRNPHLEPLKRSPFAYWRMRLFGNDDWADNERNVHKVPVAQKIADLKQPAKSVHITWLGHASFLIQQDTLNILTDPHLSDRASPFSFAGPKRLAPMPVTFSHLPKIDYVVISHNHYDHLDEATIKQLGNDPVYLVPLKLKAWFTSIGIKPDRVLELDWWDKRQFGPLTITATPSQHWSARGPFDRFETLWATWHINLGKTSVWFAGDTGYNPIQFKEIGSRFSSIDLALIPIGGYAPRWFMKRQHVNVPEAIQIHKDIAAKNSIGMHWGTFQLTAEPIDEPKRLLDQAAKNGTLKPGKFTTMAIGETRILKTN